MPVTITEGDFTTGDEVCLRIRGKDQPEADPLEVSGIVVRVEAEHTVVDTDKRQLVVVPEDEYDHWESADDPNRKAKHELLISANGFVENLRTRFQHPKVVGLMGR